MKVIGTGLSGLVGSRIVELLKGRVLCVKALTCHLGMTQSAVSQHLRILRDAGLVIDEKRGYYVHYRINEKALAQWHEMINQIMAPKANKQGLKNKKGENKCVVAMKKTRTAKSRKT